MKYIWDHKLKYYHYFIHNRDVLEKKTEKQNIFWESLNGFPII